LSNLCDLFWLRLADLPSPPSRIFCPTVDEARFQAGFQGEERVLQALFAIIPQDWHVVSGYVNMAGETDFVLVTPNGLMAIEVKSYSGNIYCLENTWFARKSVGKRWIDKPIQDQGGRPPNQQVNAVADKLEMCFAKLAPDLGIGLVKRVVVFAALNARLVKFQNPGVNMICTPAHFTQERFMGLLPPREKPLNTIRMLEIIQRDHRFCESRRKTAQKRGSPLGFKLS
jgi:hypothetical protein